MRPNIMAGRLGGGPPLFSQWASILSNVTVASYVGQVSIACGMPNLLTNNRRVLSRMPKMNRVAVTRMKFRFAQSYLVAGTNETAPGDSCDFVCQIEYPRNTFTPILFSGIATVNAADGSMSVESDWVNVSIPANTLYWTQTYARCPTLAKIVCGTASAGVGLDTANGGATRISTTDANVTDQTGVDYLTWSAFGTVTTLGIGPTVIASDTTLRSELAPGDSIDDYREDRFDGTSLDIGLTARIIGNYLPYIKYAVPSQTLLGVNSGSTTNMAILASYCSDVVNQLGGNDSSGGADATTVLARRATFKANAAFTGKRWIDCTFTHRNVGGSYTDIAGQIRNTVILASIVGANDAMRAGLPGVYGLIECDDLVSTGRNSGYWIFNGTPNYFTADGTHPSVAAMAICGASARISVFP